MPRLHIYLLLFAVPTLVLAQDASRVLRTSVSYRTQRATPGLTDEQKKQADDLLRQAQEVNQQGKYGEALRHMFHGMAVMRNQPWTPAVECVAGLDLHLNHSMVEPGQKATLTLTAIYPCAAGEPKPTMSLGFENQSLLKDMPIDQPAQFTVPDKPAGDYALQLRISGGTGAPAAGFSKPVTIHIEPLAADAVRLRDRLAKETRKNAAVNTAEYSLALYTLADRGEVNPHRARFQDEFAVANALLDAVDAGKDPFASRKGDMRKAYRSDVDQTLQPYRLFVPAAYDADKVTPLVVALHGMGGDENSMFDSYANGALKREAERLGFLVVCPKGRDSASMYRGSAEQDVLDVLAEVRRDYKVDANRVYLMGHSMGAYGTWSTAMDHPEIFAALGPISGGGDTAGMAKIHQIPQYVVHGDDDRTVNVSQSRRMVEAGKAAGTEIVYVEVPGGSHTGVAVPQFAPMLDFFAKHAKGGTPATK
jgi:pimeloyl-ACP methyl ester carboxylesterase